MKGERHHCKLPARDCVIVGESHPRLLAIRPADFGLEGCLVLLLAPERLDEREATAPGQKGGQTSGLEFTDLSRPARLSGDAEAFRGRR